jgi:hypothetical protein
MGWPTNPVWPGGSSATLKRKKKQFFKTKNWVGAWPIGVVMGLGGGSAASYHL